MITFDDIPGVVIHPIAPEAGRRLRLEIRPTVERAGEIARAMDAAWDGLKREQPRLYDGPVLLVDRLGISGERVSVQRGSYKALATAGLVGTDVYALGVQGLVIARDRDGDECVLLGRRSGEVRMYPGMWENAPSGSVPPPDEDVASAGIEHLTKVLRDEGLEELGVDLGGSHPVCIALLEDRTARSIDVVLRVEIAERVRSAMVGCTLQDCGAWEYTETAWSPRKDACAWAERGRGAYGVSPPTRALMRWM